VYSHGRFSPLVLSYDVWINILFWKNGIVKWLVRPSWSPVKMRYFHIISLLGLIISGCGPPYETDPEKVFGNGQLSLKSVEVGGRAISFAETGQADRPLLLFIHGTPGSWQAFGGYLADRELASRARMIALDRPGFGESTPGELDLSFESQASTFRTVIEPYLQKTPVVLVGHSLGAPLAARMVMDYPDEFSALVLIAPSLDPDLENPRWYNRLADYRLASWLVPESLALANREVMALRPELQAMDKLWGRVKIPVVVIQGMEDKLVDPANADYAEKKIDQQLRVLRIEGAGHFILWEDIPLIRSELLSVLDDLDK
jgi:pimeloyl-ACP methyl ester carboxylesterase